MTEAINQVFIKMENEETLLSNSIALPIDIKKEIDAEETASNDNSCIESKEIPQMLKYVKTENDLETTEHCKEEFEGKEFDDESNVFIENGDMCNLKTPDDEVDSDKVSDGQNLTECGDDIDATSKPKRTWPKKYICQHCGHSSAFPSTLKRHIIGVHLKIKKHKCDHCDYTASRPYMIKKHIECVHDKIKNNKCEHCDFVTSSKHTLKIHIKSVHLKIKNFQCEYCDYKASVRASIRSHISIVHPEIKEHQGEECDCSTTTNHDMNCVHSKIEYHECEYCDYRTIYLPYLKRHVKNVHFGRNRKEHKCDYCGYTTCWKDSLKLHINTIHLGIKKHECGHCDYKASTRANLKNHIHSNHLKKT